MLELSVGRMKNPVAKLKSERSTLDTVELGSNSAKPGSGRRTSGNVGRDFVR